MSLRPLHLLLTFACLARAEDRPTPTAAQIEFFEKEVRPVLAENCYSCHGPKKQKSGLRLDSREFILKGGEVGPVVLPGNPAASRLILSVNHVKQKDVEAMPGEGEKLPPAQIAALTEWVKQGLPWPTEAGPAVTDPRRHWAFQPVVAPPAPAVRSADRIRSPLDAFVLAKLEAEGLTLSPEAPRDVLARRLYLTLWGLAPTATEIESFVQDRDPQAVEKLVDRLLAAPAFGERWGRHWLDVARYADTKGYVFEEERRYAYAYTYRDWVIAAFNRDLPYDRFLKLQLAADQYTVGEDNRDLAALGYLTLGRRFLNNQHDIIDDRIDVVMRGMQGLTMACARCHDHKFDPLPTGDYYSLHAIFSSSEEPKDKPLLKPFTPTKETEEFEAELARLQKKGTDFVTSRREGSFSATKTAAYLNLLRRSLADPKLNADQEAKRLALYPAVLAGWRKVLAPRLTPADPIGGLWARLATTPDEAFAGALAAQLLAKSDLRIDPLLRTELTKAMPKKFEELAGVYANLLANSRGQAAPDRKPWAELFEAPQGPTSPTAESLIGSYVTADAQAYRKLVREAEAYKATNPKSPPRAMVLVDKPKPVNGTILLRGNPGRPGKSVPRQYLEVLSTGPRQPFTQGSGRRELAEAIASPANPLTARVMVNRMWHQVFGQPLVETPSDFGVRTAPPRNPALLEHLSARFVAEGWSMKRLLRTMVLSATFRQSSALHPLGVAKDPENLLSWRMNRRRLDFESMRDSMLRAAGRTDGKAGGQPFDLIADFTAPRRTVFSFIDRQNLPAVFRTFDFANPDYHVAKRNQTTTPQQALWMINHPFARTLGDDLAAKTAGVADPAARIQALYRATLGRGASPAELALATDFLRDFDATPPPASWKNGIGGWDAARKVVHFTEMKTRVDDRVAPQAKIPDPVNGFAFLTAKGGHPGNDERHAVIRRWQAGAPALARVEGELKVPAKTSLGVRARIVSDRRGLLGEWVVKGGESAAISLDQVDLAAGETLDFILDDLNGSNSDGFTWAPMIKDAKSGESIAAAAAEFGQTTRPQTAWSALAQVLLQSNEFNFVD